MHGFYSFLGSDDVVHTVHYHADAKGFHIIRPPPPPQEFPAAAIASLAGAG